MEDEDQLDGNQRDTTAWIIVLAVAITCCAILFVVFANYLVSINKNLAISNTRLSVMEEREDQLLHEIQALHHDMASTQGSANPPPPKAVGPGAPPPVPSPTQDKPAATTPAAPPGTPPTAPTVAPVTSPTSVPEIPNTH